MTWLTQSLDWTVDRAHRLSLGRFRYHPYFVATDLAALASWALAVTLCGHFRVLPFWVFLLEFFVMVAAYRVFLLFKARVLGIRSRSFLQDTLLFLIPAFALLNHLLGYPLALAFDLFGATLPLFAGMIRIGCFLGGCCYGVPSRHGVLYSENIFKSETGCRTFQPGANPQTRVIPTQLIESAGLLTLSFFITQSLLAQEQAQGRALPTFLLGYSAFRFGLDFFRRSSARPRVGFLSEAQVFCLVTSAASSLFLLWWKP